MQEAREKITALLEQSIGLKSSAIGVSTLERAVHTRMRVTDCRDVETYLDLLNSSFMEMRRLVEEVVVPETWFFRDQEPFTFLADVVVHSEKDLTKDIFRILSLPCSTGEEPYSIAMTLLLAGVAPSSFYIDAVDVSGRVLERARLGVYRDNSFRTSDLSFRDIYFTRTAEGFVLQKGVRDKVRFLQGNIIQPGFIGSLGRYDVVFCRNVLIYFNEEAQKLAIEALHQALVPGGILFTGHAEASLLFNSRLFTFAHAKAFAFRRQALAPAAGRGEKEKKTAVSVVAPMPRSVPVRPVKTMPPPARAISVEQKEFVQVRQLADAGKLAEAARQSEEHLRQHGPSAVWYYLLGIIRDSLGQPDEALRLLRKAVYLDPENVESLIYLALLAERAGDLDGAANYKRRARKLQEGGKGLSQEKT
jgi:chemotaxis protein methyltransferase WspC